MTTEEIRAKLKAGEFWDGAVIFGLKPVEWGDKEVHEMFPPDGRIKEDGTVKTYREYLLILAENDEKILARLVMQDKDTNIRTVLKAPELAGIAQLVGVDNIYSLQSALELRSDMTPLEEDYHGENE